MHGAHRAGRTDDIDAVSRFDLAGFRNRAVPCGHISANGSGDAHAAIVYPAHRGDHGPGEGFTLQDED